MTDLIEGVSLLLFGLLLLSVAWSWASPERVTVGRGLAAIGIALWGGWLVVQVGIAVLTWLTTFSLCVRC